MLRRYNDLPQLVYRMYIVVVIEKEVVQILLGHDASKEYEQHETANELHEPITNLYL
jgi:hypothetical protein